jgi:hypothetical protein
MSGYGSGRRRTHHLTGECLPIDTAYLRKCKMLTGKKLQQGKTITFTGSTKDIKGKETETKHQLHCVVERYGDEGGEFSKWDAVGHMTLLYDIRQGDQEKTCSQDIPLVVTHPNYGGVRWWYLAPCCGRRCRVLYLPTYGSLDLHRPTCRECLGLHYASQMQSYIERHKTYEKHLLANYGWAWAEMDYHCLREHYLEITPEIEYLRQRSILEMRMRMLRLLLSSTRVLIRTHFHALRSLRSEEDRHLYVAHLSKEMGEGYALDLVRMLSLGAQYERTARASSSEVFNQTYTQLEKDIFQALLSEEQDEETQTEEALYTAHELGKINLHFLLAYKQGVEEDIKHLEQMKPAA